MRFIANISNNPMLSIYVKETVTQNIGFNFEETCFDIKTSNCYDRKCMESAFH
ncbi:hypothetical protein DNHGIG_34850 [Collibacillus ludicampi]|uniref:Uncharacterized protein n=1 Tax=Collibacillus ludicampi TaxID=2771369 RepID=A0AAV4LJ92_9BACL|nr:hypothetical protein DNHGIG_34850 [Collibacillus ludicampi]